MTPDQVALVQSSWGKVKPIADQAAGLFYGRLFEIAPDVKPLFKGDMAKQGKLLMTMIDTAVAGLSRLDMIIGAVSDLGRRHTGYGVREEDYAKVGEALLWTLDKGLGRDFTPDVRNAWAAAYGTLSATMIAAAK